MIKKTSKITATQKNLHFRKKKKAKPTVV